MRAVKDHPEIYEQYVEGWGFIPRPCAIGTVFNQTECMCAEYTKVKIPGKGRHASELLTHLGKKEGKDQESIQSSTTLVRVFSDGLVAFLYFDICHYRQSNLVVKNPEFSQPVVAGHFQ